MLIADKDCNSFLYFKWYILSEDIQNFIHEIALENFLRYLQIETTSSEKTGTHPSTPEQLDLG
ncbi:unnamed protein product, partial [marine sediment metagenome]